MRAKYHHVPKPADTAFSVRHDILPHFGTVWHYHPEIELHYVIRGEGVRFIGNNVSSFTPDEMLLLGSNLPHTWKCNPAKHNTVEAVVMHFHPQCLGKDFLNINEMQAVNKVLTMAKTGLVIQGSAKQEIKSLMLELREAIGIKRVILMLQVFQALTKNTSYSPISGHLENNKLGQMDRQRIDKIISYTFNHFKDKISISQIADTVGLGTTSFCRYFKMMTNKSYLDFLTEVRLNNACRLIIESKLTMENIAIESGFENTSNFYRHFKLHKQCTPSEYRKKFSFPLISA